MRHDLFVYGLLMYPQLLSALTDRQYRSQPASLPGHARLTVQHPQWPPIGAVIADGEGSVNGVLVHDVDAASLGLLDRFENVAEQLYVRAERAVLTGTGQRRRAQVYLAGPLLREHLAGEWDQAAFHAGYFDYYRDQVIPRFRRELRRGEPAA